ncbi:MAG: ArsA family ATPase [Actinomycetota bacterium]|nr:ArsA family ATPase [Actinomycetota bacterium]
MPALLDKRLIFVTGKGGVGKTSVATAIGLLAARRGLRTIVAELAGQQRIQQVFDRQDVQFSEIELASRLFTISIDPQHAMQEYLHVKTGLLGDALGASRLFGAFAMAAPGMRELLSLGKVWELAQPRRRTHGAGRYDLVVVDAPASGHCAGLLHTPKTFAEIARVGPIAHQGRAIAASVADHRFTGVVAVTTLEEMPVNETLWLSEVLANDDLVLDVVIINAVYPPRFEPEELADLRSALARTRSRLARSALKAALSEHARTAMQREQRARLQAGFGGPLVDLPYVFAERLGRSELAVLADALEPGLLAGQPEDVASRGA